MHILLRRLLIAVPTLALLSLTVFLLLELAPGDAAMIVLDGSASGEQEAAVRESLGLNQSVLERYVRYMVGLLRGDFGRSAVSGQLVSEAIALRLPYTIGLLSLSIVLGLVCGMLLGLIGALRHDTAWDVALTGLISITTALPVFWVALLLVNVLAVQWRWLPVFGADTPKHAILPAVCTALTLIPGIARITRTSLLEVFGADYILTARAKGLPEQAILRRHISPLIAIPIITYIGLQSVRLIGAMAVIETIFSWPGLGSLAINASFERDAPLLLGTTLAIAVITFGVLLFVDLLVVYLDPRIGAESV